MLASSPITWCTSLSTCSAITIADQLQKVDMFGVWAALPAPACISSGFIAIIGQTADVDADSMISADTGLMHQLIQMQERPSHVGATTTRGAAY